MKLYLACLRKKTKVDYIDIIGMTGEMRQKNKTKIISIYLMIC
jgi:hypothetical protein